MTAEQAAVPAAPGATEVIEGIDPEPLRGWLVEHGLMEAGDPPFTFTRLTGGSNVTVRVQSGPHDWVLRRPPVRGGLPTAHDVLREYRLQVALAGAGAGLPLATMVRSCDDTTVLGAPFYVMQRMSGIPHTPKTLEALTAAQVHGVGLGLAEALAQLHSVDPATVAGMEEFARSEPYADRQLRRWAGQWERARQATGLGSEPALDRVFAKLAETKPPVPAPRVVHGDYGMANVLFRPDEPTRVQAILDWELTALGDALADLGALVAYWSEAGRLMNQGRPDPVCHPSAQTALPSVAELVAHYAATSGAGEAAVERLDWYVALAVARLGVITAGARARMDPDDPETAARRERSEYMVHALATAAEAELGKTPGT